MVKSVSYELETGLITKSHIITKKTRAIWLLIFLALAIFGLVILLSLESCEDCDHAKFGGSGDSSELVDRIEDSTNEVLVQKEDFLIKNLDDKTGSYDILEYEETEYYENDEVVQLAEEGSEKPKRLKKKIRLRTAKGTDSVTQGNLTLNSSETAESSIATGTQESEIIRPQTSSQFSSTEDFSETEESTIFLTESTEITSSTET
jgi:hypothetical protein